MSEEPSHKGGYLVFLHSQIDQTVLGMTQPAFVEIVVASEESWVSQLYQEGDYFVIMHPASTNIDTNLMYTLTPAFQ